MKKFLSAMMLILILSSVSFGAVSEDMNVYVRQDVFDAKMEALFERLHGEIVGMKSEVKAEIGGIKEEIGEIKGDIKALSERVDGNFAALSGKISGMDYKIDALQTVVYWGLGILSFLVASFVLAPIVGSIVQNLRKPSFTLDDVKRLIAEAQLTKTQI